MLPGCSRALLIFTMPPPPGPERLSTQCGSSSTLIRAMDLTEQRETTVKDEVDEEEEAMQQEIQAMWGLKKTLVRSA